MRIFYNVHGLYPNLYVIRSNLYPIRFHQFLNRLKQDQIISELTVKEAEMLRQMQQYPKQFDPSKLEINIECPEPGTKTNGMGYNINNLQQITASRTNMLPEPAQTSQEKFQNT